MLMWEISSGQPPFMNYEHDYYLAMNIINGIRPRIISGTPLEYESLMKQCWDADPLKRPKINTIKNKIKEIYRLYQNMSNELEANNNLEMNKTSNLETSYTSRLFTSKVHQFENFPEPRNATEEEQEAFYSKSFHSYDDFHIPDNIDDFGKSNKSNNQKNNSTLKKISSIFKDSDYYNKETMQHHAYIDDDKDEVYNNPNLHSEEQDELEIPDGKEFF
ncbi:hypothetical protein C1645_842397 [Glomus cerebriforme]|uniref:Serine-threonine/tyrosine-protein kinase catalytic domain-containing protein n=1 Tax=Glomus cerebriforme TaxID=658196 RepID=A0A397S228_9GLOM|nr:hypothetical protein C1645_842397 [Glomus cerebriforme]